jgi:serine/threonine-protein kinase
VGNRLNAGDRVGPYRITSTTLPNGYEAIHIQTSRAVVLEVWNAGTELGARIAAAAHAHAAVNHPGIAPIVDYGMSSDGQPWMASERVAGTLVHDMLVGRSLRADKVAELIRDIADVLRFAHAHDLVHGRLRAHSIVALPQGVSISGWGIGIDRERSVYDAPEARASARADVYALGVIAYRALTGQFPRGCLTTNVPGAPPALAKLIVEMTAPDPARRPSAADVRDAIAELLGEQPVPVLTLDDLDDFGPESELPRDLTIRRPKWTPPTHLAPVVDRSIAPDEDFET